MAAAEYFYDIDVELFPDGAPCIQANVSQLPQKPVARVRFEKNDLMTKDGLFPFITFRRSTKQPYDLSKVLTDYDYGRMAMHIQGTDGVVAKAVFDYNINAHLRSLEFDAIQLEADIPRTHMESVKWTRIGSDEIRSNPDGISLYGSGIEAMNLAGLLDRESLAEHDSMAHQGGIDLGQKWASNTANFGYLCTSDASRISQVKAGEAYVRLNVAAAMLGVKMHPLSQLLQEYPEMADLQKRLYEALSISDDQTIQMFYRLGYAQDVGPSPRRPLSEFIIY